MSEKRSLSRADQVRQRRTQRATKEIQQVTKQSTRPIPKVTSRNPTLPLAAVSKERESTRRYKIALGSPEFHLNRPRLTLPKFTLPRLPQGNSNWRNGAIVLAFIFAILLILANQLPYFYVSSATVFGNTRIPSEEINGILGVAGQNIFTVQPQDLERRLRLNYPEITAAQVDVYLLNTVYVTITERQPVLVWHQAGQFTWVDETGVAFRPRGDAAGLLNVEAVDTPPAGLNPSTDPYSPPPFIQKDLVDAALALAPTVPAGSTLAYSSSDGFYFTDPRGWKAAFGTTLYDMPLKIRVYQALVESLAQRNITPVFISVIYPDGPYYRMSAVSEKISNTQETVVENP